MSAKKFNTLSQFVLYKYGIAGVHSNLIRGQDKKALEIFRAISVVMGLFFL